jgi:hypothetical protein
MDTSECTTPSNPPRPVTRAEYLAETAPRCLEWHASGHVLVVPFVTPSGRRAADIDVSGGFPIVLSLHLPVALRALARLTAADQHRLLTGFGCVYEPGDDRAPAVMKLCRQETGLVRDVLALVQCAEAVLQVDAALHAAQSAVLALESAYRQDETHSARTTITQTLGRFVEDVLSAMGGGR